MTGDWIFCFEASVYELIIWDGSSILFQRSDELTQHEEIGLLINLLRILQNSKIKKLKKSETKPENPQKSHFPALSVHKDPIKHPQTSKLTL